MTKKKHPIAKPAHGEIDAIDTACLEELRQLAIHSILEPDEPLAGALAELAGRIEELPPPLVSRLLLSLAQEGGEKALPLLECQAQSQVPSVALAAVEALGAVRSAHAAELLSRTATADPSAELRKQAKRALFRLRSLGVSIETPAAQVETTRPKQQVFRTILGSFDGAGNRPLIFGIERPLGGAHRIVVFTNSRLGLTHCAGSDMNKKALTESMDQMVKKPAHGIVWADAPVSYCQHLVREAMVLNSKSGTALPRGYYYWKDEVGKPDGQYDRPLVYQEIIALEVKWDPTLLEQSGKLLDLHEFDGWAFDPEEVNKYYVEIQMMSRSAISLPGYSQKERQEAIMRRFFDESLAPGEQARYKFQLEEMAYLFLRHDRRLDARRSVAAAIAMEENHGGDLIRVPFMLELLLKSFALVERGLRGGQQITAEDLGIFTPDQIL